MTHLLAFSVGPVQEFIAAARRTRDLWFGSHLLSEVSRAVAKEVENQGGKLIFPASSDVDNIANVILAELNAAADPKEVATKAKKGAQNRWLEFAEEARREGSGVIRTDILERPSPGRNRVLRRLGGSFVRLSGGSRPRDAVAGWSQELPRF